MDVRKLVDYYHELHVDIPNWLKKYSESSYSIYVEHRKRELLVEHLLRTDFGDEKNMLSGNKDSFLKICPEYNTVFLVQKLRSQHSSRYTGGEVYEYRLTIFSNNLEVLALSDISDDAVYDSHSISLPIMDLYDIWVDGKKRRPRRAHVCGLQGFNPMRGDECPGCAEERSCR